MSVLYSFSAYAEEREKEKKHSEITGHFLENIYPFMTAAEFEEMEELYSTTDEEAKKEYVKRMEEVAEFRALKMRYHK